MKEYAFWTEDEIAILKRGFLTNTPLKVLAHELKRSAASLQKALVRFQIREKRKSGGRPEEARRRKQPQEDGEHGRLRFLIGEFQNVTEKQVIAYLLEQGEQLEERVLECDQKIVKHYFLHNRPVSFAKLLIRANQLRLETRQPIFVLENLSFWDQENV